MTELIKPEVFVAITIGAVLLFYILLKFEASRILKAVDRIPSPQWFEELGNTLRELKERDTEHEKRDNDHEKRISFLEGRSQVVRGRS